MANDTFGIEIGEGCNRDGCKGVLEDSGGKGEIGGCSCHLGNAPCSYCMYDPAYCSECGWEPDQP